MIHRVNLKIGEEELVLETGRMAKQANGAVFAQYGGTAVLATVCSSDKEVEGLDYVPLQVEYNEKYYAAGKIPGGFLKREGRPKDKEILVSRLIDRPMRPLFDKLFKREIQIVPTTISADQINQPDIVAMIAASAAVHLSDIPFAGPVGAVRIGVLEGELIINPTYEQSEKCELEIVVAGTKDGITMVEGGAKEVQEEVFVAALDKAQDYIVQICRIQEELRALAGKEKLPITAVEAVLEHKDEISAYAYPKLEQACFVKGKQNRNLAIRRVRQETLEKFRDSIPEEQEKLFGALMEELETQIVRKSIVERNVRTDGRGPTEIRPITCEVTVLPRVHGSALFTRGETQALAVATLGTVFDEQITDDIEGDKRESFMLHYNFPPYSVGETGRLATGRREIGHGNLALRAIKAVLPSKEDFPYTIRIVSEVLESNGSSSMATVCGSTLSLLDAGVPIRKPVAGIAMGLIKEGDKTVILSDILGEEDHLGDMDFKVAGTEDGITGFQMDIKISGVSKEIMTRALEQARAGRLHILGIMNQTLGTARGQISEYAPKIITLKVDTDKIGLLIGPGGKTIKGICEKNDVKIDIENDGTVNIYSRNRKNSEGAQRDLLSLLEEPEVGKIYNGVVRRIMDFGAFVEFMPGKEGLVHISKLARHRVESVVDVVKEGQEIPVKLVEIDKMGRMNLSYIDAIDPSGETSVRDGNSGRREERFPPRRRESDHGERPRRH
jgi:polyribonucleotide nucleotidyltransferase